MEEYRKITEVEFEEIILLYNNISFVKNGRKFVSWYFPSTAHKVYVKANSEYNDSNYDLRPKIIVLDKEGSELTPTEEISDYMIAYDIWNINDLENAREVDDLVFYMESSTSIPELYIKVDGEEEN